MSYLDELRSSVVCQVQNATCSEGWTRLDPVFQPASWANLVSSMASMLGSVLMFVAYGCFRDYRTGTRRVATSLALANFILALGSFVGAANYIVFSFLGPEVRGQDAACTAFGIICQIQAFVTWTSAFSSFVWTILLSGTLYVALVRGKISFLSRPVVWLLFFLASFVIPLVIFVPVAGVNQLGYSPFYTGAGCFISTSYQYSPTATGLVSVIKGLEVISYCMVVIFFALISFDFKEPTKFGKYGVRTDKRDYKLLSIPFLFVLSRIWGTLVAIVTIVLDYSNQISETGCVPTTAFAFLYIFSFLQAIGDPGQGWANIIPFILLSPKIRRKMLNRLFCLDRLGKRRKSVPLPQHAMGDITSESVSASSEPADIENPKLLHSSPYELKERSSSDNGRSPATSDSRDSNNS